MALPFDTTVAPAMETSIVIHLWIEPDGFWRGRVSDGDAQRHFEDGHTLMEFIGDRLVTKFGVALPTRRVQA
jgi:hypothetical protein